MNKTNAETTTSTSACRGPTCCDGDKSRSAVEEMTAVVREKYGSTACRATKAA